MSDSDPCKTRKPKLDLISALCPKLDEVPDFSDGSKQQRCMGCDTPVFNLSVLSEQEAHKLIIESGDICIRYETSDVDEPIFRQNNRSASRNTALAGGLSLALGMTACGIQTNDASSVGQETTTQPTTNAQQTSSTVQRKEVGIKAPQKVGKVARKLPLEVERQMEAARDNYIAGTIDKEEYSATISEIKRKAFQDMDKHQNSR